MLIEFILQHIQWIFLAHGCVTQVSPSDNLDTHPCDSSKVNPLNGLTHEPVVSTAPILALAVRRFLSFRYTPYTISMKKQQWWLWNLKTTFNWQIKRFIRNQNVKLTSNTEDTWKTSMKNPKLDCTLTGNRTAITQIISRRRSVIRRLIVS